jgi:vesicle coat complex subunit
MTLKEKIENKIKKNKIKQKKMNESHFHEVWKENEWKGENRVCRWILSELEKMTCQNCKLKDHCSNCLIQQYGDIKITFCSEWDEK